MIVVVDDARPSASLATAAAATPSRVASLVLFEFIVTTDDESSIMLKFLGDYQSSPVV